MVVRNPANELVPSGGASSDRVREDIGRLLGAAQSYIEAAERLLEFETSKAIEPLPPKRRVKRLPTCEASALTPQALRGPGSAWPESPPLTADQQKALADIAAAVEHDERRRVSWEVAREGALSGGEV